MKKFRHVGNSLSPNTPPIEFFNIFFEDDFTDVIVYQSNLYNTQRSIDGYQLPTNKHSSSEKSFQSVKPVSKTEIKNIFGIIFLWGFINIQIDVCIGFKTPKFHLFLKT